MTFAVSTFGEVIGHSIRNYCLQCSRLLLRISIPLDFNIFNELYGLLNVHSSFWRNFSSINSDLDINDFFSVNAKTFQDTSSCWCDCLGRRCDTLSLQASHGTWSAHRAVSAERCALNRVDKKHCFLLELERNIAQRTLLIGHPIVNLVSVFNFPWVHTSVINQWVICNRSLLWVCVVQLVWQFLHQYILI